MEIFFKDIEIFYKKSGDKKETIFFLHGWGGSTNSFNYFSEELKNKYTCISLDFPPFGNSEMPYEPWTLNDYCEIIRLIQKKESIQK
ncbi:MAG: alpha/beta hydrolase, partial [Clostridia bacterium]